MKRLLLNLTLILAVAACSSPPPTLSLPPTLAPGETAALPTDFPTPAETATPLPVTATLSPTATPAPDYVACPLTNLPVSKSFLESRRPILVQIGNSNPERPQFGLMQADLVF